MVVKILDGGFATCLEKIGHKLSGDPLWSARLLVTEPSAVVKAHECFIRSGADVVTTCSYQASVEGFEKHLGVNSEEALELMRSSVTLAKEAVKNCGKEGQVLVAGSVGPYGACLADGSEYSGSYLDDPSVSKNFLMEWHRPRIAALVTAGADLLAIETMPGVREVEALVSLLREFPTARAWVSFSCRNGTDTSHGEDIGIAAKKIALLGSNQIERIGVNCCQPEDVSSLLRRIREEAGPDVALVAYPNAGKKYDPKTGTFYGPRADLTAFVREWVDNGADLVGGCCHVYPEDIERLKATVKSG